MRRCWWQKLRDWRRRSMRCKRNHAESRCVDGEWKPLSIPKEKMAELVLARTSDPEVLTCLAKTTAVTALPRSTKHIGCLCKEWNLDHRFQCNRIRKSSSPLIEEDATAMLSGRNNIRACVVNKVRHLLWPRHVRAARDINEYSKGYQGHVDATTTRPRFR